jgi:hypothetical protein
MLKMMWGKWESKDGDLEQRIGENGEEYEVRSPAERQEFSSSLCVQSGSGTHPASCTMGTVGPFPGAEARPGRDADHSPPSSAVMCSVKAFSVTHTMLLWMKGWQVNDESERIGNEAAVAQFKVISRHLLTGTKKTQEKSQSVYGMKRSDLI